MDQEIEIISDTLLTNIRTVSFSTSIGNTLFDVSTLFTLSWTEKVVLIKTLYTGLRV